MRKTNFLTKIHKEGKLQIVEPSDIIKSAYVDKSESHMASAKLLLVNNRLEEAVSMAYYSMYHMSLALLFRVGIKCENHMATAILLKEVFSIDSSVLMSAKRDRVDVQYYVDFHITKEEIEKLIEMAEEYNATIYDFIEKLNNEMITEFRKIFSRIIK